MAELERMGRLRRFLSPQLAELIVDSGDETFLESHRREIVVVFCDLRGFTPFAESSEPEEVMGVLGEYHQALGRPDLPVRGNPRAVHRRRADGVLQRPGPCDDAAAARRPDGGRDARPRPRTGGGVERARGTTWRSASASRRATRRSGRIGFEGRFDYAAIGSVTNLAARLCADAEPWQILATERVFSAAGPSIVGEDVGRRAGSAASAGRSVPSTSRASTPRGLGHDR